MLEAILRVTFWLAAGEAAARLAGVPLPGSVLGLLGLYADMARQKSAPEPLARLADGLLPNMAIFFVPAGAGVVAHTGIIQAEALPILGAVIGGTLIGIGITAVTVDRLATWEQRRTASPTAEEGEAHGHV